jgi:hypothetical protein
MKPIEMAKSGWFCALAIVAMTLSVGRAQNPPPPETNAMIQLMTSQAAVDISSPPVATVSFDPPVVRPGEVSIYRITVNAIEAAVQRPAHVPTPKEVTMRATTQGQILPPVQGMIRPFTTFNYEVQASESGLFNIPAHYIEVSGRPVLVPDIWLEVMNKLPADHEPARRLILNPELTNVFVGQTFAVQVVLPSTRSNTIEGLSQLQINGDGFVVDKNFRAAVEPMEHNGRVAPTLVYQTTVRAVTAGQLQLTAQGFPAGNEFGAPIIIRGQVTISSGPTRYILLDSEPKTVNVRPLPPGKPAGFTGAIGTFTCDPPRLGTNSVRAGDAVRLTMTVRGESALGQLVPPQPPRAAQWQIFPATEGGMAPASEGTNAGAIFHYTLIPLSPEIHSTPVIPFSCFDPKSEKYVDLTLPPVALTVTGESLPDELVSYAERETEPEKKLSLSSLAALPGTSTRSLTPVQLRRWFPFLQVSPLLVFAVLWQYERRRRFLEQHPEILRRRRARRELKRQRRLMEHAAAMSDSEAFLERAISSLQVACAPHYPAEPRALVCAEVQAMLPNRNGEAKIVQKFFDAANAARFGASPSGKDLLKERAELNAVLDKLKERLCD